MIVDQRIGKRLHAAGLLIMFLWDDQRHRHIPRRLLQGIHQPVYRIQNIHMNRLQRPRFQQYKNRRAAKRRKRITGKHGSFFYPNGR